MASTQPPAFAATEHVILVADLEGYAKAFRTHSDEEMARFLDEYYRVAQAAIAGAGGRVVKFIGDSVLATFEPAAAPRAVSVALSLRTAVESLGRETALPVRLGVNVHMGPAVDAELGAGPSRRRDIVGRAVNQTFLLGRGAGIRLGERVYRALPSAERTPWTKNKPPALSVLEDGGSALDGMGKSAEENTARW